MNGGFGDVRGKVGGLGSGGRKREREGGEWEMMGDERNGYENPKGRGLEQVDS